MTNNILDKVFDIIFNEERIKLIREINEGYNHLILPNTIDIKPLEELGFSFFDIPGDDMCWDVELPCSWRNEISISSPSSYAITLLDEDENIRGIAYCYINGLVPVINIELNEYKKRHK